MGSREVHNHGMALGPNNKRVRCNYCGKIVSGFNRLQQHLGGVGSDVSECHKAPQNVKEMYKKRVIEGKMEKLIKEVGDFEQPVGPRKRNSNHSRDKNDMKLAPQNAGLNYKRSKYALCVSEPTKNLEVQVSDIALRQVSSKSSSKEKVKIVDQQLAKDRNTLIRQAVSSEKEPHPGAFFRSTTKNEYMNSSFMQTKRSIGRFFIENGIDFAALGSSSFRKILEIANGGMTLANCQIPTICEIKEWILDAELIEIEKFVEDIRQSWVNTGCTIILDVWCDHSGRNLMNVLVSCLKGTIYLRSVDVTNDMKDSDALKKLLDGVIQEVGVQNVVQIISNTTSGQFMALGKELRDSYNNKSLFCTISITHCIELMLEAIGKMDFVQSVMQRAKMLTKFIYKHSSMFELMLLHTSQRHIVRVSKLKAATPFWILQNMVEESENIIEMFGSYDWKTSALAQTTVGASIDSLVTDDSFWVEVGVVLQAAMPLIKALIRMDKDKNPHMAYIYESMSEAVENIGTDLGNYKLIYEPFGNAIAEIISTGFQVPFHVPLYILGHCLNAKLYYGKTSHHPKAFYDEMIKINLLHMVGDLETLVSVWSQFDAYSEKLGAFKIGSEFNEFHDVSPVDWWRRFGGDCPELQNIAVRVLSQTCNDGSSYKLRRASVEKLLSNGMNCIEKEWLKKFIYVQYNLQLKQLKPGMEQDIEHEDVDLLDDWI